MKNNMKNNNLNFTNATQLMSKTDKRDFTKTRNNLKLNPLQITGFTDGDGGFFYSIFDTANKSDLKRVKLEFKITQKSHSEGVLHEIQKYFDCGSVVIDNKNTDTKKYHVSSLTSILNVIMPHFEKFPCITSKHLNFLDWKEIALIMERKEHLSVEGFNLILKITNQMNSKRSFEAKFNYLRKSILENFEVNPYWLQAFVDGEGTFYNYIPEQKGKYQICESSLEIGQNSHDILVLRAIQQFFNSGYLKPKYEISDISECKKSLSVNRFILRDTDKIIKFIEKYPLFTRKTLRLFRLEEHS
jgi:hypothetical protein